MDGLAPGVDRGDDFSLVVLQESELRIDIVLVRFNQDVPGHRHRLLAPAAAGHGVDREEDPVALPVDLVEGGEVADVHGCL